MVYFFFLALAALSPRAATFPNPDFCSLETSAAVAKAIRNNLSRTKFAISPDSQLLLPAALSKALGGSDVLNQIPVQERNLVLGFVAAFFGYKAPDVGSVHPVFQSKRLFALATNVLALATKDPARARTLVSQLNSGEPIPEAIISVHQGAPLQDATAAYLGQRPKSVPTIALASDFFKVKREGYLSAVDAIVPSAGGGLPEKSNIQRAVLLGGYCDLCVSQTIDDLVKGYRGTTIQEFILPQSLVYVSKDSKSDTTLSALNGRRKIDEFLSIDVAARNKDGTTAATGPVEVSTEYGPGLAWEVRREGSGRTFRIILTP